MSAATAPKPSRAVAGKAKAPRFLFVPRDLQPAYASFDRPTKRDIKSAVAELITIIRLSDCHELHGSDQWVPIETAVTIRTRENGWHPLHTHPDRHPHSSKPRR